MEAKDKSAGQEAAKGKFQPMGLLQVGNGSGAVFSMCTLLSGTPTVSVEPELRGCLAMNKMTSLATSSQ